jgi:O-antigen ligase
MEITNKRQLNLEKVSLFFIGALILLLPIFVLPWQSTPFNLSKGFLFYGLILISLFFWLSSGLQNGEIKIPKSFLLLACLFLVLVWFLSAVFSPNKMLSFVGLGSEIDTFSFILFSVLGLFLVSVLFQPEKRAALFYPLTFVSGLIVFLFELFHLVFKFDFIPFKIFNSTVSNLIGNWNDVFIFFGFIALVSLIFFELYRGNGFKKFLFFLGVLLSLAVMVLVNFFTGWIIFGFSVFILFVYSFLRSFYSLNNVVDNEQKNRNLLRFSFFVFLIVLFFILAYQTVSQIGAYFNISYLEVLPSWQTTLDIVKTTVKNSPLLGSGPNTFLYDWLQYKPLSTNATSFWNLRFNSGISQALSFVATTGILGLFSILIFLVVLIFYGFKTISSYQENGSKNAVLISSFLGSIYLWAFIVFYSPGLVIFIFAFLNTGFMIAMLVSTQKLKVINLSFLSNPRVGFVSVLGTAVFIFGAVAAGYFLMQKAGASYFYNKGITEFNASGNISKTEFYLSRASSLDLQDQYLRSSSELNLIKIQKILSNTAVSQEEARTNFQNALSLAVSNAQVATEVNNLDMLNWMQLGSVYESILPLKITGAEEMATKAYQEALKKSPVDPTSLLALARVKIQMGKNDEAKEFLLSALKLKADFSQALSLFEQINSGQRTDDQNISSQSQDSQLIPTKK